MIHYSLFADCFYFASVCLAQVILSHVITASEGRDHVVLGIGALAKRVLWPDDIIVAEVTPSFALHSLLAAVPSLNQALYNGTFGIQCQHASMVGQKALLLNNYWWCP